MGIPWQVLGDRWFPRAIYVRSWAAAGPLVCSAWHKASYLFAYAGPRLGICFQGKCPVLGLKPNSSVQAQSLMSTDQSELALKAPPPHPSGLTHFARAPSCCCRGPVLVILDELPLPPNMCVLNHAIEVHGVQAR